ncbi:MAG: hypothetical protein NT062_03075, partial [Proteobacteria bacterium]|nr:hypothetical protein [Pseudomonadota bacterium]
FIVLLGLLIGHAVLGTRTIRYPRVAPILSLTLNTAMVAMVARMYSPFILAPGMAALAGVVMMGSSMFRSRALMMATIASLSLAVVGPYVLEAAGAIAPTMTLLGDRLVIGNLAVELPPISTGLGLVGFVVGLIGVATILSWVIGTRDADARRLLQIQAWQLRQLIPAPGPVPAS